MQYDKQSFTAGLAVGRQLKGWATGGGSGGGGGDAKPWMVTGQAAFEGPVFPVRTVAGDFTKIEEE